MKTIPLVAACGLSAAALGLARELRAEACDPPRILFVIDSSSSMLDREVWDCRSANSPHPLLPAYH